jgi:HK97 family phage prohead protease
MSAPEVRTYAAIELHEVETTDSLTMMAGRAVPYGEKANVGWYLEEMAQSVFARSIKGAAAALPLLLWHNNETFPVGKATSWKEAADGLQGVWTLDDSEEAQRAARLARDGFLTGLSVGFVPLQSEWTYADDWNPDAGPEHMDSVTRQEARLVEVSLTPTPAYAGAGVTLVRSKERPQHARRSNGGGREIQEWRDYLTSLETR